MKTFYKLVDINNFVVLLYQNLANLEIKGKAYSEKYMQTVDRIADARKRALDELANIPAKKLIDNEETFSKKLGYGKDTDLIEDTLEQKVDQLAERRLSMQIYYFGLENNVHDYVEDDGIFTFEELKQIYESLTTQNDFSVEFIREKILSHTLLDYIIDAINKETDPKLKEQLIRTKYNLICLISCVEDAFINNPKDFSEREKYTEMFKNYPLTGYEIEDYCEYVKTIIVDQINSLEKLPDKYFENEDNANIAYIKSFYLKAVYSINISELIGKVLNRARIALENEKTLASDYIQDAINKNLSYRISKYID